MDVTDSGIVREESKIQSLNAESPMDVTDLPMVTEVRDVQPLNA